MDAATVGRLDSFTGAVDVLVSRACEPADDRVLGALGDLVDGGEVALRRDRKAGLDDVDTQPRELLRDLDLLLGVELDPRRLLAVSQRRVEDVDPVGGRNLWLSAHSAFSFS